MQMEKKLDLLTSGLVHAVVLQWTIVYHFGVNSFNHFPSRAWTDRQMHKKQTAGVKLSISHSSISIQLVWENYHSSEGVSAIQHL